MTRKQFERINGFNPMYVGWGKEEEETRFRMHRLGMNPKRATLGTFYALPHTDNGPPTTDPDFIKNHQILDDAVRLGKYADVGYNNIDADVEEFALGDMTNVRWLKIKNWRLTWNSHS